jgi:ketosteroid isomerase-like protein
VGLEQLVDHVVEALDGAGGRTVSGHGRAAYEAHPSAAVSEDVAFAGGSVSDEGVHEAVLAVNRRFYEAFEAGDMDALSETWEHSTRAVCTHPGWATIHGWPAIAESWEAIMSGAGAPQFILTAEAVVVAGDVAWVTLDENLIGAGGASGTVAALNVLARGDDGQWRLVAHHGSSVVRPNLR